VGHELDLFVNNQIKEEDGDPCISELKSYLDCNRKINF
jgi:hypothetical protein